MSDTAPCTLGATQCVGGMLMCFGNVDPTAEVCNGVDDDCDGMVDEGCQMCPMQHDEVCDGIDNDCDLEIDEGCPPSYF